MVKKKTKICRTCGKPLKKGFKLCPYCGTQVDMVCLNCGKALEEDFRICPYCGESVRAPLSGPLLRAKAAGFLTAIGAFLMKAWEAVRKAATAAINWIKLIPSNVLDWARSLDWTGFKAALAGFLTSIGAFLNRTAEGIRAKDWPGARKKLAGWADSMEELLKKATAWLKKTSAPVRAFLSESFVNRRGSRAGKQDDEEVPEEE